MVTMVWKVLETEPFHKFRILVKTECTTDEEEGACISMVFEYTASYPDEPPVMEVTPEENITEEQIQDLITELEAQCQENVGMVMVFTLVSYALEWLNTKLDEWKREAEEEEERKKTAAEEAERKKFEGTRVTVETFMAWKAKFDQEILALRAERDRDDERHKKRTGRELFMQDNTLNESDLTFLGEGEGEVAVDESLFQNLDDLDLEDDDEDDEDYVPGMEDDSD
ncbi:RWD domain-containing protein 1 isoform X2 [Oratosquilla oratoria]|uniref:RWD domain-containing protein 1 isoform X2 n=1 Tax=Oratosquilla oratoria TaxID=337810 RepID=UPI003F75F948